MPVFPTPRPINVSLSVSAGTVEILATERCDTTVEVHARERLKNADIRAAELTQIEFSNDRLLIRGPRRSALFGGDAGGAISIRIELPLRSNIHGHMNIGVLIAHGVLGRCELKGAASDFDIDQCGALLVQTAAGHVSARHASGQLSVVTGTGSVSIGQTDGTAAIKNASGAVTIGAVSGDLTVIAPNGEISLARVSGSVLAKAANGRIRVDELMRGSLQLTTARGDVEVGVCEGTVAWFDVSTRYGSIRNSLSAASNAPHANDKAEVRARTYYGHIIICRASGA